MPEDVSVPGEPFCLLLLCGNEVLQDRQVESFATRALRQGMVYLSVWGSASARVEDLVDMVYEQGVSASELKRPLITTTHDDLDEALTFFEGSVRPPEEAHVDLWWMVSVGTSASPEAATAWLRARHPLERLSLA